MRGTVLMLVCGMVLSSGLPDLEVRLDPSMSKGKAGQAS